jgi:hypothetical protein
MTADIDHKPEYWDIESLVGECFIEAVCQGWTAPVHEWEMQADDIDWVAREIGWSDSDDKARDIIISAWRDWKRSKV